MAKQDVTTHELAGMRVIGGKKGTKRIGKVRYFVFHPKEKRCIGFIVKRPDLLWMFHRKDMFVSIEGYDLVDGRIVIRNESDSTDAAACKKLGVDWNDCVLWVGLPVMTMDGQAYGTVGSVTFNRITGAVKSIETDAGATANTLLGKREVPANLIKGFKRGMGVALSRNGESMAEGEEERAVLGSILVSDEVRSIEAEGGLAEKAGQATAVAADKAGKAVGKVKAAGSEAAEAAGKAVNKGAYATGKQIAKTKTMFSDFKEEYDKARGPKESTKSAAIAKPKASSAKKPASAAEAKPASAKPAAKSGAASKSTASGATAKKPASKKAPQKTQKNMFAAFKEEYDKARHE